MLVFLLILAGISSDADARLSFALATADNGPPPMVPTGPPSVPQPPPSVPIVKAESRPLYFWEAVNVAVKQQRPLVMFLGIGKSRPISGAVVGQQDYVVAGTAYADYPSIIVGTPENGWIVWREKLPATASDAQILAAARTWATVGQGKAVQPAAVPFVPPPAGRDDSLERGPWPAELEFPAGMFRYRRAKNTQSIVVLGVRDSITPVPRAALEEKWRVSGGMVGLSGWRSDVYRSADQPQRWIGNIFVRNRFGDMQPNRGHLRSYPNGTRFFDVLSKEGQVFEVRQREKINGRWDYSILYDNAAARPAGYRSVRLKDCAACHAEAGSGEYGLGLVPGGDETLSDPFPDLER